VTRRWSSRLTRQSGTSAQLGLWDQPPGEGRPARPTGSGASQAEAIFAASIVAPITPSGSSYLDEIREGRRRILLGGRR